MKVVELSTIDMLCDVCGQPTSREHEYVWASDSTTRVWCGCRDRLTGQTEWNMTSWVFDTRITYTFAAPRIVVRPDWDDYYLGIAEAVSRRGDCVRRQHGAVVVQGHRIVSTGYNGTPPGDERSCGATGACPRALDASARHGEGQYDLCWSSHAEANALLRASWEDMQGATIYVTGDPCPGCAKLIASAGIVRTVTP